MDMSKYTRNSQQALADAQRLALERSHQEIDSEHLLSALVARPEGLGALGAGEGIACMAVALVARP